MKRLYARCLTLKMRIPVIFVLSLLFLAACIIGISFRRYEALNVEKHVKMAEGITQLMVDRFEADRMDYYIENNYSSDEYMELLRYYYTLKDSYLDVRYMYVYKLFKDDSDGMIKGVVVLDLDEEYTEDVPQDSVDLIGDVSPTAPEFASDFEKMTVEKQCTWHIVESDETEGKLITFVRPILDGKGNYVCSACVDFSIDQLYAKGIDFVIELLVVITIIVIGVIVIINIILSVILFNPLSRMTKCIESFKFDSDQDRFDNVNKMEALNIHVKNEIDELYNALVLSMKDSAYYMTSLNLAKTEIREISETAYKDALTGVGSKRAYDNEMHKLQADLGRNQKIKFSIVMIDINNLKYVNDSFGHEHGDEYIKGCCNIICKVYKKSPVFRIGGDEFVVILRGDDYVNRMDCFDSLEDLFDESGNNTSAEEYCRYSASFGMADYDPSTDKNVDDVFKRADKLMYDFKKEFKKAHWSYR